MNRRLLSALCILSLAACGDDETASVADTGAADAGADSGADTDMTDAGVDASVDIALDSDLPDPTCEADWVTQVDGVVLDEADGAIGGAKAQLCVRVGSEDGNLVCLRPDDSRADGGFTIFAPDAARCMGGGAMRVFVPSGTYATMYCHIDTATDDGLLELADPITLFSTDAEELPPYGDPEEGREVVLPGDFRVPDFTPADMGFAFTEAEYDNLGARWVDPSAEGLCFAGDVELDGLWAFRVEANVARDTRFSFPNTHDWAPGATVQLYVLGGLETMLADGRHVAEAAFEPYGSAQVSEDGERIEGRIPAFTWLGYALNDE